MVWICLCQYDLWGAIFVSWGNLAATLSKWANLSQPMLLHPLPCVSTHHTYSLYYPKSRQLWQNVQICQSEQISRQVQERRSVKMAEESRDGVVCNLNPVSWTLNNISLVSLDQAVCAKKPSRLKNRRSWNSTNGLTNCESAQTTGVRFKSELRIQMVPQSSNGATETEGNDGWEENSERSQFPCFLDQFSNQQQRWLPDKAWAGEYLALSFNVVLKKLPLGKIFITSLQPTWFVFYNTKPSELFHVFSINLRNGSPDKGWGKRIFGAWKDQPTRLEQSIWDSVGWAIDIMWTII